jgi:hypothetical protein
MHRAIAERLTQVSFQVSNCLDLLECFHQVLFNELIIAYLAFDAGTAAVAASGGTSGKQQTFVCVLPQHLCAPPA